MKKSITPIYLGGGAVVIAMLNCLIFSVSEMSRFEMLIGTGFIFVGICILQMPGVIVNMVGSDNVVVPGPNTEVEK